MRTFDVEIIIEEEVATHFECTSELNMRAVLILLYRRFFGKDPASHYACSGDICEGHAWEDAVGEVPHDRCPFEIRITQRNRMHEAYNVAMWAIWHAKQPRLGESRIAA